MQNTVNLNTIILLKQEYQRVYNELEHAIFVNDKRAIPVLVKRLKDIKAQAKKEGEILG